MKYPAVNPLVSIRLPVSPWSPLVCAAGLAAALTIGCGEPPQLEIGAARRALARAAEAEGVLRAPVPCSAAQAALAQAEAEIRLQDKRSSWSRDYDEAEALAMQALQAGQSCVAHARAALVLRRDRSAQALADLESSIARATSLARHVPAGEGMNSAILRADISLGEGRSSFEGGQFERAEDAAARGRDQVREAVAGIDRFIDAFQSSPRRATWRRWIVETLRDARRDHRAVILIDKLRREMLLLRGDDEIATYAVDLGLGGIDGKLRAGDASTPEGRYRVTEERGIGQTRYYRALMLNYPNGEDLARFRARQHSGEMPRNGRIGSNIEIHGAGGRDQDWTQGCVALSNDDMDDLVQRVEVGTPVTIVGTIPDGVLP